MLDKASITRFGQAVKRGAAWASRFELLWLGMAAPFLLFPGRFAWLVFLLVPLTWACRWVATGRLTVSTGMGAPVAVLCLMAVVGFMVSVDSAMSWAKLWGILLGAAVLFGLTNALRTRRQVLLGAVALLVVTLIVAMGSLVGTDWDVVRLVDVPWVYDHLPRLIEGLPGSGVPRSSTLFHPREVGATLAMLLPLALTLLLSRPGRRLAVLSAVTLVVGGAVLLMCQSVQALAGLGMAVLLIAAWRNRRWLLTLPVGAAGGVAAVWALGPSRVAGALLSLEHPVGIGVVLRLDMWSRAVAMIGDMPYTGIGLNTFPVIQTQFYPGVLLGPEVHAHNLYLQTALDLGLPGLLALVWLLAAFGVVTIRALRSTEDGVLRALLVGLAAGALAFAGHGLLDAVTLGAKPVAGLFAMMGLAAATRRLTQSEAEKQGRSVTVGDSRGKRRRRALRSALRPALRRAVQSGALFVVLAVVVVLSWAVRPGLAERNAGLVLGHKAVMDARRGRDVPAGALEKAEITLERAVSRQDGSAHVLDLLGSLHAWQGDFASAIADLERRVARDGPDALARYAPWDVWQRRLRDESELTRWKDTAWIYTHWMNRYPDRAEPYVLVALVRDRWEQSTSRARAVLEAGVAKGAEPVGLLTTYLARLE